MSIRIIKKILILSLFCFTCGALSAEENLKSVGNLKIGKVLSYLKMETKLVLRNQFLL